VLAEHEDALIVSMLFNFSHNMRERLEQEVLDAGSGQVRRVEEYIPRLHDVGHFSREFSKACDEAPRAVLGKTALKEVVERKGIEPSTYALRTHRSPN
jgi:hypothetical protein